MKKSISKITGKQAEIIRVSAIGITRKALKVMEARNVPGASEVLNTYQHPLMDDLVQDVILSILDHIENITFDTKKGTLTFDTDECKKEVFQTAQRTFRSLKANQYKHMWIPNTNSINSKGEEVEESEALETVMYTQAVREYQMSIEDADVKELISELQLILTAKQNDVFELLIAGHNQYDMALELGVSREVVKQRVEGIRRKLIHLGDLYDIKVTPNVDTTQIETNTIINSQWFDTHPICKPNPNYDAESGECVTIKK